MELSDLPRLSSALTRSISPENPTGEKGKGCLAEAEINGPARELGKGWKCRPFIRIEPGQTYDIAIIEGPGIIQSMWFGGHISRDFILRIFWDNQEQPCVETPLPDFFATHWPMQNPSSPQDGPFAPVNSIPVAVNPNRGLNCFWEMPFRDNCKITIENQHPSDTWPIFYQINYTLSDFPNEMAYFHAQYRRVNPLPYKDVYTILDDVSGPGHYVGTSMGWGINNNNWWGEGEIKFYMDGDKENPTICGTGTEDYFGGSYNWDVDGKYTVYSTPFMGMHQVIKPDGLYQAQHRHSMYRWHVRDPIRFQDDLRVTIQALGWRSEGRFLPGQHDICSMAYWYQQLPTNPFPKLPNRGELEII